MDTLTDTAATPPITSPAFQELSMVSLKSAVDQEGVRLPAGTRGAIVFVYDDGLAYEVEFVEPVTAVLTLRADQIQL